MLDKDPFEVEDEEDEAELEEQSLRSSDTSGRVGLQSTRESCGRHCNCRQLQRFGASSCPVGTAFLLAAVVGSVAGLLIASFLGMARVSEFLYFQF